MAAALPVDAIRQQISSGVDIIIHLGRLRDHSRRVLEIGELMPYKNGEVAVHTLYRFKETGMQAGRIVGKLEKTGDLVHVQKREAAGIKG